MDGACPRSQTRHRLNPERRGNSSRPTRSLPVRWRESQIPMSSRAALGTTAHGHELGAGDTVRAPLRAHSPAAAQGVPHAVRARATGETHLPQPAGDLAARRMASVNPWQTTRHAWGGLIRPGVKLVPLKQHGSPDRRSSPAWHCGDARRRQRTCRTTGPAAPLRARLRRPRHRSSCRRCRRRAAI